MPYEKGFQLLYYLETLLGEDKMQQMLQEYIKQHAQSSIDYTAFVTSFEQFVDAPAYPLYVGEKLWTILPAAALLKKFLETFEEFPPSQAIPGFNPVDMMGSVYQAAATRQGN